MAWTSDPREATDIVERIRQSDPTFVPSGDAAPQSYRLLLSLVGFPMVERLAAWRRRLPGR